MSQDEGFSTRAVHAGQDPKQWKTWAVIPPISLSTTFAQPEPANPVQYEYSRSGNPTRQCYESALAALEDAKYALTFASGLATLTNITYLLKSGEHILCGDDVYGGTGRLFRQCSSRMGIEVSFVDQTNVDLLIDNIRPNTRIIWLETPTNPTLKLCDIRLIVNRVRALQHSDIWVMVDNTFMSPFFQKPLNLGADLVMHSITKYLNGHSDVVMGCIATNDEKLNEQLAYYQNALGAVPSPFDCFLANRGLKTLAIRMERHERNALKVASFLESHSKVQSVLYPGLKSHPQHELARKQCTGFSGMLSFYLKGDEKQMRQFITNLKLFTLAESLGAVESLAEIPSLMTHASHPPEVREQLGITDSLIRLSIGIEEESDLIADLEYALEQVQL